MDADQLTERLRAEAAATVASPDVAAARRGVDRRIRASRLRRGVAAVAVVLVVLVAGAVVLTQHGGQSAQHVVTRPEAVPHLAPTYVPPDVTFSQLIPLPSSTATRAPDSKVWIYATGASGNPVGGPSFAILSSGPSPGQNEVTGGLHEVALGDQKGWGMIESDGGSVVVLSRDLPSDRTEAIARAVRQDAVTLAPTHVPVPAGFQLAVAGVSSGYLGGDGVLIDPHPHGYALAYDASDPAEDGDRTMVVGVTAAGPSDLLALRWELDDVQVVQVGGHEAIVGTQPGGSSASASSSGSAATVTPGPPTYVEAWLQDGALVTIQIMNLDGHCPADCNPAVVERVAASVAPVASAQWQAMLDATTTTTALPPGCVRQGNGEVCSSSGSAIATDPGISAVGPTTTR